MGTGAGRRAHRGPACCRREALEHHGRELLRRYVTPRRRRASSRRAPDVDGDVLRKCWAASGAAWSRSRRPTERERAHARSWRRRTCAIRSFRAFGPARGVARPRAVPARADDVAPTSARRSRGSRRGEPALVDCAAGEGRALCLASDLDNRGNDFPLPRHVRAVPARVGPVSVRGAPAVRPSISSARCRRASAPVPGIAARADRAGAASAVGRGERRSGRNRSAPAHRREFQTRGRRRLKDGRTPRARLEAREQEERQHIWQYVLVVMWPCCSLESCRGREGSLNHGPSTTNPFAISSSRVRARWRRLVFFRRRCGRPSRLPVSLAAVLFAGVAGHPDAPIAPCGLASSALLLTIAALVWGIWGRHATCHRTRGWRGSSKSATPSLDERLVSAVDVADVASRGRSSGARGIDGRGCGARRRVRSTRLTIVPARHPAPRRIPGGGGRVLLLAGRALPLARPPGSRSTRRRWRCSRRTSSSRSRPATRACRPGTGSRSQARLVGNRAPVVAQLLRAERPGDEDWQAAEMETDADGPFHAGARVARRARSATGSSRRGVTSPAFDVSVVRAPRVTRIDVEYTYPPALGLAAARRGGRRRHLRACRHRRARARFTPTARRPPASMVLAGGKPIALCAPTSTDTADADRCRSSTTVVPRRARRRRRADESRATPNISSAPSKIVRPKCTSLKPASDRRVTRLEEVDIEAEAAGRLRRSSASSWSTRSAAAPRRSCRSAFRRTRPSVDRPAHAVPRGSRRPAGRLRVATTSARAISPRGKRSSESRSDIFFLEVKPFEEEFTLAQSQARWAAAAAIGNSTISWPRRRRSSSRPGSWIAVRETREGREVGAGHPVGRDGGGRAQDARRADVELVPRVDDAGSAAAAAAAGGGRRPPPPTRSAPARRMPEEDAMTAAVERDGQGGRRRSTR